MKIVDKPWGKEEWLELNDKYCFKKITLFEGCKTSLQYHNFKEETIYIVSGTAILTFKSIDNENYTNKVISVGDIIHCKPKDVHRLEAINNDLVFLEASTPEVDDVVRLEDSYGRR